MWVYIVLAIVALLLITYLVFAKQINYFLIAASGKKRIQKNLYKSCKMNDFLIISDLHVPIDQSTYRYIDTLIFGNKYIYIISEITNIGKVLATSNDRKWRVINEKNGESKLTNIDNPFLYNRNVIAKLVKVVPGLELKDFKSFVIVSKLSSFESISQGDNEYIVSEKDAMKTILQIEKNSNEDIFDSYDVERYVEAFYKYGLEAEKIAKEQQKEK